MSGHPGRGDRDADGGPSENGRSFFPATIPEAIANPTGPPRPGLAALFNRPVVNGAPTFFTQSFGTSSLVAEPRNNLALDHEEEEEEEDEEDGEGDGEEDDNEVIDHEIDDDEESESDEDANSEHGWSPIIEDVVTASGIELEWINQQEEYSALDDKYWKSRTFFDLEDSQLVPIDSGKIEWLVKPFNGTKENPNNELIMRSSNVYIGGLEWRIKLFPHGDECRFLSVYIECVSMQSPDYVAFDPLEPLPFPRLTRSEQPLLMKRRSISAQISVIMYNPNEPRVFEFRSDAHQFQKFSSDYGWKYFTTSPRSEFHRRKHGQREAILRNDQLAFRAYIRVFVDPTGCMWEHDSAKTPCQESIALTGLRPFFHQWPQFAASLPLLHLRPVRQLLRSSKPGSGITEALKVVLFKMYTRQSTHQLGKPAQQSPQTHAAAFLQEIVHQMRNVYGGEEIDHLLGSMDPTSGIAMGINRLKIETDNTLQDIVDNHYGDISTPILLTLELERQIFDRNSRRWKKLTQRVVADEQLRVSGKHYDLYAFITHCGDLKSNQHNVYIRPNGPPSLWYAYRDGQVTALTDKQALDPNFIPNDPWNPASRSRKDSAQSFAVRDQPDAKDEVSYVFFYSRADAADGLFSAPKEELWVVPASIKQAASSSNLTEEFPEYQPDHEQESLGTALTGPERGSHTPAWHMMDDHDVVMGGHVDDEGIIGQNPGNPSVLAALMSGRIPELKTVTKDGIGVDYYNGQMMGDQRHGSGHLILLNGDEYVGEFVNNEQNGYGKMIWASSGDTYEGDWLNGKQHGQGTLIEAVTGSIFKGGWKQGKKHGKFVLTGNVTEEDRGCCTICYENAMNTAFCDCGHVVACNQCANMIDTCPVCRQEVRSRMRIYGVKMTLE
ncbi:Hypothetical protein R9X50_00494000 [Acrodontium crateriforme]|uniref:Uncharacterized protein n=1 Tax=Acrodontium crateriforme TaxID=150365 RepID=A0AAQ3RB60_9PEZI|nr:Hypothetical protein R9X50_00494000 [Acrodontium crateriforme]